MKRFLILPFILMLVLLFQNCTRPMVFVEKLISANSTNAASDSGTGNGQGYEGKPIGTFVRLLPNQKCKDSEIQVFGKLNISTSINTLTQTQMNSCAPETMSVPDSALYYSSNQSIVVGANDGLYVNEAWKKANPEKIIEGWCHEKKTNTTPFKNRDFLFSYIEGAPTINGTIWSESTTLNISFTRELKNQNVNYNSENLKITISSNKSPSSLPFLSGTWESSASGLPSRGELECRLGYKFDGVIWPSEPIFGLDFKQAKFFNKGQSAVLQMSDNTQLDSLQRWDLATGKMTILTPLLDPSGDQDLGAFVVSKDEQYVFYQAKLAGSDGYTYLSSRTDGSRSVGLNGTNFQKPGLCRFQAYDSKTKKVFFTEPSSKSGFNLQYGYLRANSAEGGEYQKLVDEIDDNDRTEDVILGESQSVVYFATHPFGYAAREWFQASLTDLVPASIHPFKLYPGVTELNQPYLFLGDNVANGPSASLYLKDNLTGLTQIIGAPNSVVSATSPDGRFISIVTQSMTDGSHLSIYDRTKGVTTTLAPNNLSGRGTWLVFTADSNKVIYAAIYDIGEGSQLFISDSDGKNEKKLSLPGLKDVSPVSWLSETGQVLYRAKNNLGLESFYLVNTESFKNVKVDGIEGVVPELRAELSYFYKVQLKNDRIFFVNDSDSDGLKELFVLYFDGRGLQQLNDRFIEYGGVVDFSVIDSKKVIFQTVKNGKKMMFLWNEPLS